MKYCYNRVECCEKRFRSFSNSEKCTLLHDVVVDCTVCFSNRECCCHRQGLFSIVYWKVLVLYQHDPIHEGYKVNILFWKPWAYHMKVWGGSIYYIFPSPPFISYIFYNVTYSAQATASAIFVHDRLPLLSLCILPWFDSATKPVMNRLCACKKRQF